MHTSFDQLSNFQLTCKNWLPYCSDLAPCCLRGLRKKREERCAWSWNQTEIQSWSSECAKSMKKHPQSIFFSYLLFFVAVVHCSTGKLTSHMGNQAQNCEHFCDRLSQITVVSHQALSWHHHYTLKTHHLMSSAVFFAIPQRNFFPNHEFEDEFPLGLKTNNKDKYADSSLCRNMVDIETWEGKRNEKASTWIGVTCS